MPPKIKFSREEVIRAALEVVDENGLNSLTARSVAGKLGSSTAPVYNHFATMDDLGLCVTKEIKNALLEYSSRAYTDRVFLNMGTGVAMFAFEHPQLYRALMLEGDSYSDVIREYFDELKSIMPGDKRFSSFSEDELSALLRKMWVFTHGLASMICARLVKDCSQDYIINALVDMGTDVIGVALSKHINDVKGD